MIRQYDRVRRAAYQLIPIDEDVQANPSYILGKLEGFGDFLEIARELSIPAGIVSRMDKSEPLRKILVRLNDDPDGIKQGNLHPRPIRYDSNLTTYLQLLEKENLISRSRFGGELYVTLTNLGRRVVNALVEKGKSHPLPAPAKAKAPAKKLARVNRPQKAALSSPKAKSIKEVPAWRTAK